MNVDHYELDKCFIWILEYGGPDCPPVTGQVAPIGQSGDVSKLAGKFRGIQGHHNSCYLDATLFSMFTFTR